MLSELIHILAEYGMVSTLIIISLSIIGYTIYKKNIFTEQSEGGYFKVENESKKQTIKRRKENLLKHDFFSNLQFKIEIDLPLEVFTEHSNRNKLYIDLMICILREYVESLNRFVNELDSCAGSSKWAKEFNDTHYKILSNFENAAKREKIPEEAIKIFKSFYGSYAQKIYFYVSNLAKLPDTSIIDKTKMILLLLELILVMAIADIKKMNILNGSLNGIEYDGLILENV